ncbi:MAG: hypothetical protein Q4B40_04200 [Clostridia bacterium]|nr:hypothetical protein [Clostridia bacterium]
MKKWLRTALVVVLIICTLPISAFAAVNDDNANTYNLEGQANINQFEIEADSDSALNAKLVTSKGVGDNSFNEAENNNLLSTANRIYSDYTVSGSLTTSDIDYYKFTLTEKSDVSLVAISSVGTSMAVLLDAYEEVIDGVYFDEYDSNSSTYSGTLTATLESGTYYWAFFDNDDYASSYRFYFLIEPVEEYTLKLGWNEDSSGNWIYVTKFEGEYYYYAINWRKIDGKWYYFDQYNDGIMVTGWQKIDGVWYYFKSSGAMVTGWQKIGGVWYYFKSGGAMVTGWQKIGGKWYAFNNSGAMLTGWVTDSSRWFYCNSSGVMQTGWLKSGGKWYYLNPYSGSNYGAAAGGWWKIGGKWYYFNTTNGDMYTGWRTIGGKGYYFNANGVWIY